MNVNIVNNQTVGQSLTLESTVTTVRGITSRVDIVWSSNGLMLKLTEGFNHTSTSNNSVIYTDIYTIPQLNTSDEGRIIQCDTFINAVSTVTASDSVTLNVTGKYLQSNFALLVNTFSYSSLYQHQYITIWSHTRSYGR